MRAESQISRMEQRKVERLVLFRKDYIHILQDL